MRWLTDDEDVVLDLHPHWKRLFWPLLRVPVLAGAAAYGATAVPAGDWQRPARAAIAAVVLVLLVGWSAAAVARLARDADRAHHPAPGPADGGAAADRSRRAAHPDQRRVLRPVAVGPAARLRDPRHRVRR